MIADQELYEALTTHAGLTALVGARVYPVKLPQNPTFPAVVFFKVSGPRVHSLSGQSGLSNPRFQITCWAKGTPLAAKLVAEQVRLALAVKVPSAQVDDGSDQYEDTTELYRTDTDVLMWQTEATV